MTGERQSISNYLIFWLGQALSLLGSRLVQLGLIWWLTRETNSATVLAGASLIGLMPQMLLGPFIPPGHGDEAGWPGDGRSIG